MDAVKMECRQKCLAKTSVIVKIMIAQMNTFSGDCSNLIKNHAETAQKYEKLKFCALLLANFKACGILYIVIMQ